MWFAFKDSFVTFEHSDDGMLKVKQVSITYTLRVPIGRKGENEKIIDRITAPQANTPWFGEDY